MKIPWIKNIMSALATARATKINKQAEIQKIVDNVHDEPPLWVLLLNDFNAIEAVHRQGTTFREMAHRLGVSEAAFYRAWNKAKNKLQKQNQRGI